MAVSSIVIEKLKWRPPTPIYRPAIGMDPRARIVKSGPSVFLRRGTGYRRRDPELRGLADRFQPPMQAVLEEVDLQRWLL